MPGTEPHPELWQMSAAELAHIGTVLAGAPYACALLSWRHHGRFESAGGSRGRHMTRWRAWRQSAEAGVVHKAGDGAAGSLVEA